MAFLQIFFSQQLLFLFSKHLDTMLNVTDCWTGRTDFWFLFLIKFCLFSWFQHQNGSVVDALSAWKRNVDKRFEGVEECYICFFILHGSTYQMPKVACPTCKKKFHSACLYKWFSTSQNSTCPLCRNLFWWNKYQK